MGGSKPSKPKPTAQEQAEAEIAYKDWERYKAKFLPYEKRYIKDVMTFEREKPSMVRAGLGAVPAEFWPTFRQAKRSLFQQGIDPTSGRFAKAMGGIGVGAAQTAADVGVGIKNMVRGRKMTGMENVLGIGRNLAGQSTANLSRLNAMETSRMLARERAKVYKSAAKANMYGTIVGGIGAGAVGYMMAKKPDSPMYKAPSSSGFEYNPAAQSPWDLGSSNFGSNWRADR